MFGLFQDKREGSIICRFCYHELDSSGMCYCTAVDRLDKVRIGWYVHSRTPYLNELGLKFDGVCSDQVSVYDPDTREGTIICTRHTYDEADTMIDNLWRRRRKKFRQNSEPRCPCGKRATAFYPNHPGIYSCEDHQEETMRTFDSGATRDTDANKPDYHGYLSPQVLEKYGQYMLKHQKQADGTMRSSDNWKKGIPREAYIKSMFRHFMEVLKLHESPFIGASAHEEEMDEALYALLFNVMGYAHEREVGR